MKSFRDALFERLSLPGAPSMLAVAQGTGVSYDQLKKLKARKDASTNAEDAVRIANFFGVSLDEFLDEQSAQSAIELTTLYYRLSPTERTFLTNSAKGLLAADHNENEK